MATKFFLTILAISFVIYFLPEYFFEGAMLYIVGGSVGGTLQEIFKIFGGNPSNFLIFSVWVVLLVGVVFLYYRLKNKLVKYFTIVVFVALLYVVDFIPLFDITDLTTRYLNMGIRLLSKSLILSLIVYFDWKRMEEKVTA
jgi:uncharacterized membrane protein YjjP (DUF1212 family)